MQGSKLSAEKLEKLKDDMKSLWQETFHDNHEYVELVFNAYFNPRNVFVRYDGNILSAALLAVGYSFKNSSSDNRTEHFSGMYLCGLATRPAYRKKGIMGALMHECEQDFFKRGYDCSFLIPADKHLRNYYHEKGYETVSFIRSGILKSCGEHNREDALNVFLLKDLRNGNEELLTLIAGWCREKELSGSNLTIVHSFEDWLTIFSENENSILLSESSFDLKYPNLAKIVSVVFPIIDAHDMTKVEIRGMLQKSQHQAMVTDSNNIDNRIATALSNLYPGRKIITNLPYNGVKKSEVSIEDYAMMKALNKRGKKLINKPDAIQISLMLD